MCSDSSFLSWWGVRCEWQCYSEGMLSEVRAKLLRMPVESGGVWGILQGGGEGAGAHRLLQVSSWMVYRALGDTWGENYSDFKSLTHSPADSTKTMARSRLIFPCCFFEWRCQKCCVWTITLYVSFCELN